MSERYLKKYWEYCIQTKTNPFGSKEYKRAFALAMLCSRRYAAITGRHPAY